MVGFGRLLVAAEDSGCFVKAAVLAHRLSKAGVVEAAPTTTEGAAAGAQLGRQRKPQVILANEAGLIPNAPQLVR